MSAAPQLPADVYVRVSRVGSRGDTLQSPQDQERDARNFAASRGLTVGVVLRDIDQSGGTLNRPGLVEALRRVQAGESCGLVAAYLSRASRDTRQGLELLDAVTAAGGRVWAPNLPENYLTADGRMTTTIQLAIDTGYRERKREEFEVAKAAAIMNGIPVTTRPAVGYRQRKPASECLPGEKPDRRLEPDPRTAEAVREVFERRAAGAGPADLADLLTSRGVKTTQGSDTWSRPAIYGLIRNRIYLGELRYGSDDRYVNAESHEPIVDLATWTAAQHPNAKGPARLARTSETTSWLLAGLVRCHACRHAMQGTHSSRGKRIYRCTRRHAGGNCPAPSRIDADRVEAAAVEAFWTLTADLEATGTVQAPDNLGPLQEALTRAEDRLAQVESEDAQDALGARWLTVVKERRAARDAAAGDLGRARADRAGTTEPVSTATLRATWGSLSVPERRDLLAARFDTFAVARDPHVLVPYATGTAPADLPRRGYRRTPDLRPFPPVPTAPVSA